MGLKPSDFIIPGAGILSAGINAISQSEANRKSRQWQEKMYYEQRKHSLEDWAMQNEYNSPASQMARLKEAGLNPNLVYGNGATHTAGSVRSASPGSYEHKPAKFDLGTTALSGVMAFHDTRLKKAQVDNLTEQNSVLVQEKLLKAAQVAATVAQTGLTEAQAHRSKYDLEFESSLRDISAASRQAALDKTMAETASVLSATERAEAMQAYTIRQAIENILTSRKNRAKTDAEISHISAQIAKLKEDTEISKLDKERREAGIYPGDPTFLKSIEIIMSKYGSKINPFTRDMPGHENDGIIPKPWPTFKKR